MRDDDRWPGRPILREMLLRVSARIGNALSPGIETQGRVEDVLRLIARAVPTFRTPDAFAGLVRMVMADARQFPWIASEFGSVLGPHLERFTRYLSYMTSLGILDCPHPLLAARQFLGLLNEPTLWRRVLGRDVAPASSEVVIEEAVGMFLLRYKAATPPMRA